MQGKIFGIKELQKIASLYGKDIAQIVLRWSLQKGVVTIPKSVHPERIISNSQIFDFEITAEDMLTIDRLDKHQRVGADPDNFNF
jgi:methylglyoxal/glyoxal reductase